MIFEIDTQQTLLQKHSTPFIAPASLKITNMLCNTGMKLMCLYHSYNNANEQTNVETTRVHVDANITAAQIPDDTQNCSVTTSKASLSSVKQQNQCYSHIELNQSSLFFRQYQ